MGRNRKNINPELSAHAEGFDEGYRAGLEKALDIARSEMERVGTASRVVWRIENLLIAATPTEAPREE